jgi:hypothetical protein
MLSTSPLAGLILDALVESPRITFAQLARRVPGFAGGVAMGSAFANLILWRGISEEAVKALYLLEKLKRIRLEPATAEEYGDDARVVGLPVASEPAHYPAPHWLPVAVEARGRQRAAGA